MVSLCLPPLQRFNPPSYSGSALYLPSKGGITPCALAPATVRKDVRAARSLFPVCAGRLVFRGAGWISPWKKARETGLGLPFVAVYAPLIGAPLQTTLRGSAPVSSELVEEEIAFQGASAPLGTAQYAPPCAEYGGCFLFGFFTCSSCFQLTLSAV